MNVFFCSCGYVLVWDFLNLKIYIGQACKWPSLSMTNNYSSNFYFFIFKTLSYNLHIQENFLFLTYSSVNSDKHIVMEPPKTIKISNSFIISKIPPCPFALHPFPYARYLFSAPTVLTFLECIAII